MLVPCDSSTFFLCWIFSEQSLVKMSNYLQNTIHLFSGISYIVFFFSSKSVLFIELK